MDVVPSIIVLAITTLLVCRRELTPLGQERRPARSRRKTQHEVRLDGDALVRTKIIGSDNSVILSDLR